MVSSGGCKELGELLGWFHPVEGLSRSAVELSGDGVEVLRGVGGEVGAFGEVLAEQAVGVLVAAALPWTVRVGEVDLDAGLDGERGVLGHLGALIPGDGSPEMFGKLPDLGGHRVADLGGGMSVGEME